MGKIDKNRENYTAPLLCLEPCFLAYRQEQDVFAGNETDHEFDNKFSSFVTYFSAG